MPKNYCIMQIWAEPEKSALPICNYSQILYQFLTFTQNLKRSQKDNVIAEKDNALAEKDNALVEQAKLIEQLKKQLAETRTTD